MDAAGAILLAITNVPEVCMCMETTNGIYGRTNNPYDGRRSAGGSSGGEGALIGAAGSLVGTYSSVVHRQSFPLGFAMHNTFENLCMHLGLKQHSTRIVLTPKGSLFMYAEVLLHLYNLTRRVQA